MLEKLALGTVQFGLNYGISNSVGQVSEREVTSILNFAKGIGFPNCPRPRRRAYSVLYPRPLRA